MIKCQIQSEIVELAPGQSSTVELTISNESSLIDYFTLSLEPIASPETMEFNPSWVSFAPAAFSLRPMQQGRNAQESESQQVIQVTVTLPAEAAASNYAGRIVVTARTGADNSSTVPFNLIVSDVETQTIELKPPEHRSRKKEEIFPILLTNKGNAAHFYSVYAEDDTDRCNYEVIPPEVTLGQGEQAKLTLKVRPKHRNWINEDITNSFVVKIEGFEQNSGGRFVQRCALPPLKWLVEKWFILTAIVLILILAFVAAAIWLFPLFIPVRASYCGPTALRTANIISNDIETHIYVSGRGGSLPMTKLYTEKANIMPALFGSLVSVSPDGQRLVYVTARNAALEDARIWAIDTQTRQRQLVAAIPTGLWPVAPVWSGDGANLIYVIRYRGADRSDSIVGTGTPVPTATPSPTSAVIQTTPVVLLNPLRLQLYIASVGGSGIANGRPFGDANKIEKLDVNAFYGDPGRVLCWNQFNSSLILRARPTIGDARDNFQTELTYPGGDVRKLPPPPLPAIGVLLYRGLLTGTAVPKIKGAGPEAQNTDTFGCKIEKVYSQLDARWADRFLILGETARISDYGCPITAAAILLQHKGVNTDPGELTNCLAGSSSPLTRQSWTDIGGQKCGENKLPNTTRVAFTWKGLNDALTRGPAIVGFLGGQTGTHFAIVTTGLDNRADSYRIVDPWDGTTTKSLGTYLDRGYRLGWLITYDGDSACSTALKPDGQLDITAEGIEEGGLYREPKVLKYDPNGTSNQISATSEAIGFRGNLEEVNTRILPANQSADFSEDGAYWVRLKVEGADETQVAERKVIFSVDRTPPIVGHAILTAVDPKTNNYKPPLSIALQAIDMLSGVASLEYRINNGPWRLYNSDTTSKPFVIRDGGAYTVDYRATDGAGNTTDPVSIPINVDLNPNSPRKTPTAAATISSTVTISTTVTPIAGITRVAGVVTPPTRQPTLRPTVTRIPVTLPPTTTPTPTPTLQIFAAAITVNSTPTPTVQEVNTDSLLPGAAFVQPEFTPNTPPVAGVRQTVNALTPTPIQAQTGAEQTVDASKPGALQVNGSLVFDGSEGPLFFEIKNIGEQPLEWQIDTASVSDFLIIEPEKGSLNRDGRVSIKVTVKASVLALNGTFTVFSNSTDATNSTKTVSYDIKNQLPIGTLEGLDPAKASDLPSNVSLKISTQKRGVEPAAKFVFIRVSYKPCLNLDCDTIEELLKLADGTSMPIDTSKFGQFVWDTSSFFPQDGITLKGSLCIDANETACTDLMGLPGAISVKMGATFVSPVSSSPLADVTSIKLTPTGRTTRVILGYTDNLTFNTPLQEANAANNWTVTLQSGLIEPNKLIEIYGRACSGTDDTFCVDIKPSITDLRTDLTAPITTDPVLSDNQKITLGSASARSVRILSNTRSRNVQQIIVKASYLDGLNNLVTRDVVIMDADQTKPNVLLEKPWDYGNIKPQAGVSVTISACASKNGAACEVILSYQNLIIPYYEPLKMTISGGDIQRASSNEVFADPLKVSVVDKNGYKVANEPIRFAIIVGSNGAGGFLGAGVVTTANGLVLSPASTVAVLTVRTDANGVAQVYVQANSQTGGFGVTASTTTYINPLARVNFALVSQSRDYRITVNPISNGQSTGIETAFAQPFGVRITELQVGANPIVSAVVTFSAPDYVNSPSGYFANNTTVFTGLTDIDGYITTTLFTVNKRVGNYRVTVSSGTATSALINLRNIPGAPVALVYVSGGDQIISVTNSYTTPMVARVIDNGGNNIPGAVVEFIAPDLPNPGGSFAGSPIITGTTDGAGVVSVNSLIANTKAGLFIVTARIIQPPGVVAAIPFTFTNTAGAPATLIITPVTDNQFAAATTQFSRKLQVTVQDAYLNTVNGASIDFRIIFNTATAGFGSFPGTLTNNTTSALDGLANSQVVVAGPAAGIFAVEAFVTSTPAIRVQFSLNVT